MDIVTLTEKGVRFNAEYAAPSVLSGRFVACVADVAVEELRSAFTEPGPILVQSAEGLYADRVYTGYHRLYAIEESERGHIVKVQKGWDNNE